MCEVCAAHCRLGLLRRCNTLPHNLDAVHTGHIRGSNDGIYEQFVVSTNYASAVVTQSAFFLANLPGRVGAASRALLDPALHIVLKICLQ